MRIALAAGSLFHDRFLIIKQLGAGGMGSVYLAEQIDAERKVAIKIMHSDDSDEKESVDRFLREFQVLSRLRHANIVTFYTAAITNEGIKYAVCEFIEGTTLESLLRQEEKLEWERLLNIAVQVCDALSYADSMSVIHRDLKPANIMILDKPEPDTVKIIDFGLARIITEGTMQKLTKTGEIIGSPHYMSPEQILGTKVDARTDLYSLACIFFEALSGKKLFADSTPIAIMQKHAQQNADLILQREFTQAGIIGTLSKALQKDPSKRFQNAQAFKTALLDCNPNEKSSLISSSIQKINPKAFFLKSFLAIAILFLCTSLFLYLEKRKTKQPKVQVRVREKLKNLKPVFNKYHNEKLESATKDEVSRLKRNLNREVEQERRQELFYELVVKTNRLGEIHDEYDAEFQFQNLKGLLPYCALAADPALFRSELLEKLTYQQIVMKKYDEARKTLDEAKALLAKSKKQSPILESRLNCDEAVFLARDHEFGTVIKLLKQANEVWLDNTNPIWGVDLSRYLEIQRVRNLQNVCFRMKLEDVNEQIDCIAIGNLILRLYLFQTADEDANLLAQAIKKRIVSVQRKAQISPEITKEFETLETQAEAYKLKPRDGQQIDVFTSSFRGQLLKQKE